ncbi:MAG: HD domain-containing protein [Acidobacteria bacterium]|nr:HD domain-containing protein [Acidobacteriota bacterium]
MNNWQAELEKISNFEKRLDSINSIASISEDELNDFAKDVHYIQNLLSLIASLPLEKRPDIYVWDDVVSRLWRKLFAKGDDIDRYTFGDLWLKVLLDCSDEKRILRTATGFIASCRNFSLFEEALEVGKIIVERFDCSRNAAYANFINTLGSVYYCKKDFENAEKFYLKAKSIGESVTEDESRSWIVSTKNDFICQEYLNLAEINIELGFETQGKQREIYIEKAEKYISNVDLSLITENLRSFLYVTKSEIAMLKGDIKEAPVLLDKLEEASKKGTGPYYYSIATTHARLKARFFSLLGDYQRAYHFIRKALRQVSTKTYPAEDIFVLEDAIKIVRKLYEEQKKPRDGELVKDLVLLLEDKDWYTGGSHSRQVADLCLKIGHILKKEGNNRLDILDLEMAGLVHDIGKLKIPWSLLNKVAPITPKEREILKLHTKFGKEILEEIGLISCADIVFQHHETIDGKGYPSGKIPTIEASIVGICDVFDASTTINRRYKQPKTIAEAISEISSLAKIKYHPDAVRGIEAVAKRLM